jgi:glycosyltransferase involved in cell wall biosynthesis
MKKLLVLTTRYPYPVIGGDRLRIYQICKLLSKQYQLTLLSLCDSKKELNSSLPEDGVFDSIERIFMPRWRSWLNCIVALPSKKPLQVAYYQSAEFYKRAAVLSSGHDATLVHLIRASDAVKSLSGLKFLEMTDAISLNYERIRKTGHAKNDWRSHVFSFESLRLRHYEEEVVDYFNHSFLVSDIDRQFLFQYQKSRMNRVSVCSNGVDLSGLPFQFSENGKDIVFIGNMFSLQNLDAANFMSSDVLPRIRAKRSDVSLRLIGRIREEDAVRLKQMDGVIVTGEVPDVAVEARSAGVGVCPLRLGAGVQNKILEYMALGLPTVSTSLGLEGFSAIDGQDLLIADDAVGLAEALLRLLNNRDEAKTMAEAARKYVELNHSWESQLAPLIGKINESLNYSNQVKSS